MGLKKFRAVIVVLAAATVLCACSGSVPSNEVATATLKKIIPLNFTVQSVNSFKGIPGLCEVVVVVNNQPMIFYLDKKGKYVVTGNIVEAATKKNYTIESMQRYQQVKK